MAGILNAELAFPQFPALDQFGPNTTLLLHGDGTNGAQNNTFLDSSTNNFTITRNGNTTQGTFSPFSQPNGWWSNYFNQSGYLYNTSTSAGSFGTGNFTVECWIYITGGDGSGRCIYDTRATGSGAGTFMSIDTSNNLVFYCNSTIYFTYSQPPKNQWIHVAVCRTGTGANQLTMYINGSSIGTNTLSTNISSTYCVVGAVGDSPLGVAPFLGYISNFRIVKGTAVYTSNFTPPTTPLTAITNTTLLTCQSNRFVDNSASPVTLTVSGAPAVQAFHPISAPTSYFPSVNGGGAYFDGSGDYLNAGSNAAFAFGTGAYTVEMWVYPFSISQQIYMINDSTGGSGFYFETNSSAGFSIIPRGGGSGLTGGYSSLIINSWNHIVFCRASTSSNQTSIFVNGARVANGTDSNNWTVTGPCSIGGFSPGSYMLNGHMSQVRLVKGTDVYGYSNTTITIPTAPLAAIANTSLLLSCTNGGIFDSVVQSQFETVGTAQVSTTQSKFGGASMYFDGSGYLVSANTNISNFGSGNFTIEAWIYKTSSTNSAIYDGRETGGTTTGVLLYTNSSNQIVVYQGASLLFTSTPAVTLNAWFHIALCRTGTGSNQTTVYINGNAVGSFTMSATNIANGYNAVGAVTNSPVGAGPFYGYIDDLRITKGVARYAQNFTPPQNAFPNFGPLTNIPTVDPNFSNTTLLLHGNGTNGAQNNTFLDSSTNNFTITRNGNTTQGTFTPFSQPNGWWSNYFGTSDSIYFPSLSAYGVGTGNFTVELWVNPSIWGSTQQRLFLLGSNGNNRLTIENDNNGTISVYVGSNSASIVYSWSPSIGSWNHIAVTRSGSTVTLYLNGSSVATATNSNSIAADTLFIGGLNWASGYGAQSYISNVRYTNTVVYSGNFTPSNLPLTAISGTLLLTCQSNRFSDNSSVNAIPVIGNGTPSIQNFYPVFPPLDYTTAAIGGSGYYDGSGDFLNTPTSGQFTAAGDFTVSCWFYLQSFAASYYVVGGNWSAGTSDEWLIQIQNNGAIRFLTSADGTFSSAGAVLLNQWTYFTATRSGTTVTVQLNGTTVRTYTKSDTLGSATKSINIGQQPGNNWPWNGYIADFRLVSGSAVTTIPTTPATAISGTGLLLSCTNGAIFDNASKNNLETVGNAQISTTQSKFGGSSMYFDGSGDWLLLNNSPISSTGDFTVELWFWSSTATTTFQGLFGFLGNSSGYAVTVGLGTTSATGASGVFLNVATGASSWGINANSPTGITSNSAWQHLALVRSGGTIIVYVNGNAVITSTAIAATIAIGGGTINRVGALTNDYPLSGYIDDFRVTNGIARYRYNFTPPIAQFPNK
jgi:hypothetical protein